MEGLRAAHDGARFSHPLEEQITAQLYDEFPIMDRHDSTNVTDPS